MHDDTLKEIEQSSAVQLDLDSNVQVVDVDGDCIPDYVVIKLRWLIGSIIAMVSTVVYAIV